MEKETNELKDKLDKEIAERKVSADIIRRKKERVFVLTLTSMMS